MTTMIREVYLAFREAGDTEEEAAAAAEAIEALVEATESLPTGKEPPAEGDVAGQHLDPDTLRVAQAIQSLSPKDRARLRAVADAFAQRAHDEKLEPGKTR